jgi:hypothetical protein
LGFSGVLLAHFQKRGENVNSTSYGEILLKLRDAIRRKRPSQLARWVLLHHDNVRTHTTRATQQRIQELAEELLEHQPYSAKNALGGKSFADDKKVENEVRKWLRQQSKDFYGAGFDELVKRWDKCINICGGYVEK